MSTSNRDAYHHGNLRERLIDLALEALEREGSEHLSLRALALEAGVSGMAPYRHFSDRAALIEATARRGFALLRADLAAADKPDDPAGALAAFAAAYVRFAIGRPGLFRAMFGGAPPTPETAEALRADPLTLYGLFASRLAEVTPPARREDAFLATWAMVHGLACLAIAGRIRGADEPPDVVAARLAQTLLDGLKR